MPTPLSIARQCLTPEAAHALDEAVRVARRRGHAQTTSLHAISALLSLPSSPLRDACARARNAAFSPRLQFKALELCLSVSLDRVPSSQLSNDPPVSNSLMAAVKRSQAKQRRQPENFYLYRDMSQQNPSNNISCVKVELQHLILSILDDPVVSRVFGEACFRSSEIKLAFIRPLPSLLRYSRSRASPVFLCNLENSESDHGNTRIPVHRGFSFSFPGFASFYEGEENCRRIGEVLARRRNPLLVGVCANDAIANFTESLEEKKDGFLSKEIRGLNIISIGKFMLKCINEGFDKGKMDSKFEEMGREMEGSGSGVVVKYGDLENFVSGKDEDKNDGVSYAVGQLTRLLQVYGGKIWLLGAATSYQTYLKFLSRFPSVEKVWDLQILPITCVKNSLAQSYPKSSLTESFVPFGGFFATPSESKGSLSSSYRHVPRCHLCDERCAREVMAISKGGFSVSVADQCRSTLPSWLQMTEVGDLKAKDGQLLNTMVAGLQSKWDNICQRLHLTHPGPHSNTYRENPPLPTVPGFRFIQYKKEIACGHSSGNRNAAYGENNLINLTSSVVSRTENGTFLPKLGGKPSKGGVFKATEPVSPYCFSNSSVGDASQASPTSLTSVTTDLGLGLCSISPSKTSMKPSNRNHPDLLPANVDAINGTVSSHPSQSSSSSSPDFGGKLNVSNFKKLFEAVIEKVGWQPEAVSVICQTVASGRAPNQTCHRASRRGDIWLNFSGPDRCSKKKIAVTLADIIYGTRENFICVDLSSQDGVVTGMQFRFSSREVNYDSRFRGKTVVDYIADELSKKPLSVVFLENVDRADIQVQSCLSQAIRTGKFSDSHGREVGISNAIFVTTSTLTKGSQVVCYKQQTSNYSEEKILRAKGRPLQLVIKYDDNIITKTNSISKQGLLNKRKLIGSHETLEQHEMMEITKRANRTLSLNLDLNIPAEVSVLQETDEATVDNDCVDESPMHWLQDFFDQSIKNVVFKSFDFDALAGEVRDNLNQSFHKSIGAECSLEIESEAMEQLVAVAYLSDEKRLLKDWVEQVLSKGFAEVEKKRNLNAHTVVKLVPYEGFPSEEQTLGLSVCAPPRIILN
ncbi:PHD finger family protein [Hibiscus syriacus]|uniref:PHD finger family protein n=1 Tax=Hibiscus syriacus TaxID=106335 RepID=A0A6A2ZJQ7_HIBSY|nr:protein SMAX1-LIKE 7-like [Hibiscus syriacus]KAE8691920.1 PHD finger family protein [Hibiscus syriacus]